MNPLLLAGTALVVAILCLLEWRRPDRRRLALRLLATWCAVGALVLLSVQPNASETDLAAATKAILWTHGATPDRPAPKDTPQFVLADSANPFSADAKIIPDPGFLRRHAPRLRTLEILGDGPDPAELPALAGLQVEFAPSPMPPPSPAVDFLSCPRQLPLGAPVTISGRVAGLPPGATLPLSLEAPDGVKTEAQTSPADARGHAVFDLRATPLPATGRFLWRLRAGATDEPIGIAVAAPSLPRVLALESAPQFDTAALRRWYASVGGAMTVRTEVGKDVFRSAATAGSPSDPKGIDAALLSSFDLVLTDRATVVSLSAEETAALADAMGQRGVGVLVVADDAMLAPTTPPTPGTNSPWLPWKLTARAEPAAPGERTERLRWPGQTRASEIPLPVAPYTIARDENETVLVTDGQQQPLAVALRRGHGQLALTLVHDTSRLVRGNDAASFAEYWSFLFSRLARPLDEAAGRWTLAAGGGGDLALVDHPLELLWTGSADKPPTATTASSASGAEATPLALAQDASDPGRWRGTLWPREPGWHRVASGSGTTPLDFYVHPATAWPALQAERRRQATARYAAGSLPVKGSEEDWSSAHRPVAPGWWFVLLVISAGFLWTERRFAGTQV